MHISLTSVPNRSVQSDTTTAGPVYAKGGFHKPHLAGLSVPKRPGLHLQSLQKLEKPEKPVGQLEKLAGRPGLNKKAAAKAGLAA
jgi:hypothetical protein